VKLTDRSRAVGRVARLVGAAAIAGAAVVGFTPVAEAETTTTIAPTAEAWYQPNPSCASPAGCIGTGTLPPASTYPAGTLHIGVSAGEETARSYVAFPFVAVTGTITAAALTVPLDPNPADGGFAAESGKVEVCLTSAPLANARGSFDPPPTIDCSVSVPASYVATPQPHLDVDLGPLVNRLQAATGIVLLPDATASTPTESWRVVFSAHDAAGAPTTAASVTLKVQDRSIATSPGSTATPTGPIVSGVVSIQPPLGTGFAVTPSTVARTAPAPSVGSVTSAPRLIRAAAYAYPGVWLLPLVMLVLVPMMVKALTTDLVRAGYPGATDDLADGPSADNSDVSP
jgi:hypothetical protein